MAVIAEGERWLRVSLIRKSLLQDGKDGGTTARSSRFNVDANPALIPLQLDSRSYAAGSGGD
jgi:hypothetical protein